MALLQPALLAIVAAALALVALGLLHLLRPDLAPSAHMISEYAIGAHGYVMTLSFAAFAAATLSLFVALLPHAAGALGRIGLGFLLLAALGLAIGGAFAMDPITTTREATSLSGRMHGVGFMIGVPGQLLAVLLLSLTLGRQAPWSAVPLMALALADWACIAIMVPLLVRQRFFGIPNRAFMLAYAVWLILAARPLLKVHA